MVIFRVFHPFRVVVIAFCIPPFPNADDRAKVIDMNQKSIWAGCDVGSSRTKVAVLDENKKLVGYAVHKSGTDFTATAQRCLDEALAMAGRGQEDIVNAVSTGYGRKNVSYASGTMTEIGCHAAGCFYYFPKPITIIDIGGQDNKVIKLNEQGHRLSFKMNRK